MEKEVVDRIIGFVHRRRKTRKFIQQELAIGRVLDNYKFELNDENTRLCIIADIGALGIDIFDHTAAEQIDLGRMRFVVKDGNRLRYITV